NGMQGREWKRGRSDRLSCAEWPEHRADATRFLGGRSVALTVLTYWTRATMTDAGGIDHPHTAVTLRTAFLGRERETSRTLDSTIWLRGKVLTCDASHSRNRPFRRFVRNLCLGRTF